MSAATSNRSIFPKISGVPWWAAILIAMTATGMGLAFDSGSGGKELTIVFAASYVVGCLAAVLAVRQSGVFTAVIQPPLLLFCAVPGAYWLFHGAKVAGVKDILINCGYPLIERFPLMAFTSAGVLLIGLVRWYRGTTTGGRTAEDADAAVHSDDKLAETSGFGAKLAALLGRGASEEDQEPAPKVARRVRKAREAPRRSRSRSSSESRSSARSSATRSTARRSTPTRSRSARPPLDDAAEQGAERARRQRPRPQYDVDGDAEPPVVPRRRPRPEREAELRSSPPRETRRDPHTRYGRPPTRTSRFDPYEPVESYDLPPRRRPTAETAVKRTTSTHHPISQVRYRGASRSRGGAQTSAAESWEYDV
jgi:hypothetical protein